MSTPPMPGGPQDPRAPQGQPYPPAPQGQQFPGAQPYPGGAPGPVAGHGPVPGAGPMPQGAAPGGYPPVPGQQQSFPSAPGQQQSFPSAPGQSQPFPQAPGQPQPFPQAPMGAPVKKGRGRLAGILSVAGVVVIGIIVKLVLSFGIGSAVTSADDAHNTAVGECASVTGTTAKPNYEKVDCASGKQNYVVGVVMTPSESCPDAYDEYYESGTLNNVKLCMAPVLDDGKCYALATSGATTMGHPAIACTDPSAIQVKVVKDKTDVSGCKDPNPQDAMIFQPLKLVYCLSQPSGS